MSYGEEHNVNQHSKTIVSVLEKAALESIPAKEINSNREIWKNDSQLNDAINLRSTIVKGSEEYKLLNK